jgi:hypothetical protein
LSRSVSKLLIFLQDQSDRSLSTPFSIKEEVNCPEVVPNSRFLVPLTLWFLTKATRQVNATSQSSNSNKKDKIMQIQDSTTLEDEVESLPSYKTAMECKLTQISPDI